LIVKSVNEYSKNCNQLKYKPNKQVVNKASIIVCLSPTVKEWWAQTVKIPDDSKITVFNNGVSTGFKVLMPSGGQILPIQIDGIREKWAKAQKIEKNSKISEIINKIKPIRKPSCIAVVWFPRTASFEISSPQRYKANSIRLIPTYISVNGFIGQ
jgi:hypothetical protein